MFFKRHFYWCLVIWSFQAMIFVPAFAQEKESSFWTRYIPFLNSAKVDDSQKEQQPSLKQTSMALVNDCLPNHLPGIIEYRLARQAQLPQNRGQYDEQDVYDLFEAASRQGNILATLQQNQILSQLTEHSAKAQEFLSKRIENACRDAYTLVAQHSPDAQYLYARACFKPKTGHYESWMNRAFLQYQNLAEQGSAYGEYMLGQIYLKKGERKTADDWFLKAFQHQYDNAICHITNRRFYEDQLWLQIDKRLKNDNSCVVDKALICIAHANEDVSVAYGAYILLLNSPTKYKRRGVRVGEYYFLPPVESKLHQEAEQFAKRLNYSQLEKAYQLANRYHGKHADFVDEYLTSSTWSKLKFF